MYALVVGRAYPDEKTGMMGIFEYEQAVSVNNHGFKTVYAFCDTRSIKRLRVFNYVNKKSNDISIYGYHFPIGGLPKKIFDQLKQKRFKKLLEIIIEKEGKPSIIHVHFPLLNLNMEIWSFLKKLNVPIVLTEHWSKIQLKELEQYRVDLLNVIVEESNSFNSVGEKLKESIQEITNTDKEIQVIPNMVSPAFYYNKGLASTNDFIFIAIGRLVETKQFDFLIDVFSKTFRENDKVFLNIVGDGPLYNKLRIQINDLNMNDRIVMHGFLPREKTAEMLQKSNAFVSASIIETFGVPFIEAMACGKPVISIENGPLDSYIDETKGELFKQGNKKDLENKLLKIYTNRSYYDGEVISSDAYNNFSESAIISKIIRIYNKELDTL